MAAKNEPPPPPRKIAFVLSPNLQIIVGGVASTPQDVRLYASCSLLAASSKLKQGLDEQTNAGAIEACVEWLMDNEFISIKNEGEGSPSFTCFCVDQAYSKNHIYIYDMLFLFLLMQRSSTAPPNSVLPPFPLLSPLRSLWLYLQISSEP